MRNMTLEMMKHLLLSSLLLVGLVLAACGASPTTQQASFVSNAPAEAVSSPTALPTATATSTAVPTATATDVPARTVAEAAAPTATATPKSTHTPKPMIPRSPTATSTPTPTSTPAPTSTPTPRRVVTLYVSTPGFTGLNMRSRPSPEANILLTIPYRARVQATMPPVRGTDGQDWYQVRYRSSTGYSLGSLLSKRMPEVAVKPAPTKWLLGPMAHDYQSYNNCAANTTMMTISYFGLQHTQYSVGELLRPNQSDVNVTPSEVMQFVKGQGLGAVVRLGGTPELVRRLVANDIPVMLEHLLDAGGDIGHYSVVRGYDRASDTFIVNDGNKGPMRYIPVSEYMRLWEPYQRTYIPIYRPSQEVIVREILGPHWDAEYNPREYAQEARSVVAARPSAEAWMNLGYALYLAGEYQAAVEAYYNAREYGISPHALWYTAWPAAALNRVERYSEALSLTDSTLAEVPVSGEMLLERGNALLGLGRSSEAARDFRLALQYSPSLWQAREALQRVR